MKRYMRQAAAVAAVVAAGCGVYSCSDVDDCSIDGRAMINCTVYTINPDTETSENDTLPTLTVTALGTDSIIVNRMSNVTTFSVPLSYVSDSTVLVLHYDYANNPALSDTICIRQTNTPYFESLDCGYTVSQTVDGVDYTKVQLDSIYIKNENANTNGTENLKLYYRYAD